MPKSLADIITDGLNAEREAISYYTFLLPYIHNGNHRRSILHILNDEKEHLRTLKRIQKEMGLG